MFLYAMYPSAMGTDEADGMRESAPEFRRGCLVQSICSGSAFN